MCSCVCVCACVSVRLCKCVRMCMCECGRMCVHVVCLYMCVHVRLQHACIPVNFISCIITECQGSANCTIRWGQTKVCKFCMAASPCSCAPLPLAQSGPLLPAAGGWGLVGKVQAEQGGASSPLVTLNKENFRYRPPKNLNRSP